MSECTQIGTGRFGGEEKRERVDGARLQRDASRRLLLVRYELVRAPQHARLQRTVARVAQAERTVVLAIKPKKEEPAAVAVAKAEALAAVANPLILCLGYVMVDTRADAE